ncbi:MAG: hypothetical protein K2J80_03665 [Oscillospiraceae bacterium]|nr:hypothetical protein [Oscillospiraceae bacterium]
MGLFGNSLGKKPENKGGYSYILEIARLITDNKSVLANLKTLLETPDSYFADNAARYAERGMDVKTRSHKELYWIALADELSEGGCMFEVDWKCELEDFLWALEQLNDYDLVKSAVLSLELPEDGDVEVWGEELNAALDGKTFVCCIDIDSDSYPLMIVTAETLERIQKLAADNGQMIDVL